MGIYYIDGEFLDEDKAFVSVKDMIVLRGFGVFDFLRTYNRRPFYLKEHIERLYNSAKYIGLDLSHSVDEICNIVEKTIDKNPDLLEANIRIVYSGGVSPDGVTPAGNGKLMVMVTPKHENPASWYSEGAKILTTDVERYIPESKSTNYLNAVIALQKAKKDGAIENIYIDRDDRILEGTTTNFFGFKNGKLITPGRDMLPGITRSVILELAKDKYDIEIRDVKRSEIKEFDEIFISASNKEIIPVIKVNDLEISKGKPGKDTLEIMKMFAEYTKAYGEQK